MHLLHVQDVLPPRCLVLFASCNIILHRQHVQWSDEVLLYMCIVQAPRGLPFVVIPPADYGVIQVS
jgi:hypothetical protein